MELPGYPGQGQPESQTFYPIFGLCWQSQAPDTLPECLYVVLYAVLSVVTNTSFRALISKVCLTERACGQLREFSKVTFLGLGQAGKENLGFWKKKLEKRF